MFSLFGTARSFGPAGPLRAVRDSSTLLGARSVLGAVRHISVLFNTRSLLGTRGIKESNGLSYSGRWNVEGRPDNCNQGLITQCIFKATESEGPIFFIGTLSTPRMIKYI